MFKPRQLTFFLITLLFWSCKTENKFSYAIKDFRNSLKPYLTEIVSKGIVMSYDSSLRNMATDKELIQLGQSEHPVLRASAFREMLHRESFNHFEVLMSHLDDTATVATDAGEFGIWYRTVSDDIIEEAGWKDTADKNKTIDEVITKHNYLRSAYKILLKIKPQERYYPFIKDMAIRERKSIGYYYKPWNEDIEFALYGLANFKKVEDIKIIKELLLTNAWNMHNVSFNLLKEFPDTAYLEVFETYYKRNFYDNIYFDRSVADAVNFIQTVATYKNDRSAKILEAILNKKPFINCSEDTSWLKNRLIYAIWNNPCEAYLKLRQQVEWEVKDYEKNTITLPPVEPIELPADTTVEKISW
jgi:hypothetical protein